MKKVTSRDGTTIAYDRVGRGRPLILVDGALCSRSMGPMVKLAPLLAPSFSVLTYDRRGRGDSGDTAPYAVEREIEDLAALVDEAGGSASVLGISSGAVLALRAAAQGVTFDRLALYEAPFMVDDSRPTTEQDWVRIDEAIAAGRPGDAVKAFLKSVGLPGFVVAVMRVTPLWSKLKAVAPTLPHDGAIVREFQRGRPLPPGLWAGVTAPALALDGGKSPPWMRAAMRALADALPRATYRTLDGQTHDVSAKVLAPVLVDFLGGARAQGDATAAP